MGELADHAADVLRDGRRTGYYSGLAEAHQDLVDRIAELEQRCAMMEAAASMASATFTGAAAPLTNATRAVPDDVLDRLADAEQRAAAAWAAVTKLVQTNAKIASIGHVVEVSDHIDAGGTWRTTLTADIGGMPMELVSVGGAVAILTPSSPANPDLLERASVELAEAYQRAKAEEQRQAEKAAATGTTATTASVDKIAREFCAQIVENVKR